MKTYLENRPILIIANSSWYLYHYRKLLIEELNLRGFKTVTICPLDKSSDDLSKITLHVPWRINRSKNKNLFNLFISLIRLIFILRTLKPRLVHSHTLKTNFLATIASFILGIPCVLSFAGLGQIKNSKFPKNIILITILKIIGFLSFREFGFKFLTKKINRTYFIFQNKDNKKFIEKFILKIPPQNKFLIFGSGLPNIYLNQKKIFSWEKDLRNNKINFSKKEIHFIYCARLLKSKGILTFIELAKNLKNHKFSVYGGIDPSSSDSLNDEDLNIYKEKFTNLKFHGVKPYVLLNISDEYPVLIVPSLYGEGFPRGISEAIAMHIPVIASREASSEIFDESHLYIPKKNDIYSLNTCIKEIIEDHKSNKLKEKLKFSEEYVKQNFLESIIVDKTISIYKNIDKINNNKKLFEEFNNWLPF